MVLLDMSLGLGERRREEFEFVRSELGLDLFFFLKSNGSRGI